MTVERYVELKGRLLEKAQRGDEDAFGTLVLRDQDGLPLEVAALHRVWTRFIRYAWSQNLYAGILAPWRHGKTSLGVIRKALWEIGHNPGIRIRVVSGDDEEAMERVESVRRYIASSDEYKLVFPGIRPARLADWTKHRLFVERPSLGPDPTLEASGVFTGEAGGGNDLIILDDIVTYQNSVLRATSRPHVYTALTSVWLRRIEPTSRVLLVGTTWHAHDAYGLLRKAQSGQWLWLIQGISEDFHHIDCRVEQG